ncbi:MAG TPA: homocysteine methyltransferase [Clostridiaceae bacterium]|nr:homocysteine methyltransferase [Clostridiaceae bacterium]
MIFLNSFLNELNKRILVFDGSKGYLLQKFGMKGGECPELWNVERKDIVKKIYSLYKEAGSDVIQTNTFTGNRAHLERHGLEDKVYELNFEGTRLAKEVMGHDGFVAASIGPTGMLMEPMGDLTFDKAYELYKEQIQAVVDGGADIINFETFTDVSEMRAALLAAKATADLPVICSMSFEANGRTLMGTDPETVVLILKSLGADLIGTNCSFGPELMVDIVRKMHSAGAGFLSVKPNAGLPEIIDGVPVYKENPDNFAKLVSEFVNYGGRLIGGCCGTTPEFIRAIRKEIDKIYAERMDAGNIYEMGEIKNKEVLDNIVSSSTRSFSINDYKNMKIGYLSTKDDLDLLNKLTAGDLSIVMDKTMDLSEEDYDCIQISIDNAIEIIRNSEKKESDSCELLARVVNEAQGFLKEPIIFETKYPDELERALRIYKGRAGVVLSTLPLSAKDTDAIRNVAKKYGAVII